VGQLSEALGPVYLAYGRALMQQAIENCDALLVNKEAVPVETLEAKKAAEEEASTSKAKLIDLPDIIQEEEGDVQEEEEEVNEEENKEEPADDFQLAWEVLDTARLIYAKQTSALARQVLADIHQDLGDLQMENELFPLAIEEFRKALDVLDQIQAESQTDLRRAVASIWFKVSMAHEYAGEMKEAVEPLEKALDILSPMVEADVKELVEEVKMKLAELKASIEKADLMKEKIVVQDDGSAAFDPSKAQNVPVNDLSGLVRKRKKEDQEDPDAKKLNTEENTN
jgi:tetratricopeptide (TPR) repeat protein